MIYNAVLRYSVFWKLRLKLLNEDGAFQDFTHGHHLEMSLVGNKRSIFFLYEIVVSFLL